MAKGWPRKSLLCCDAKTLAISTWSRAESDGRRPGPGIGQKHGKSILLYFAFPGNPGMVRSPTSFLSLLWWVCDAADGRAPHTCHAWHCRPDAWAGANGSGRQPSTPRIEKSWSRVKWRSRRFDTVDGKIERKIQDCPETYVFLLLLTRFQIPRPVPVGSSKKCASF